MTQRSDAILEVSNVQGYDDEDVSSGTRMRFGYPRMEAVGPTPSDLTRARRVLDDVPSAYRPAFNNRDQAMAPQASDSAADIKRALAFKPSTGVSFISGARYDVYLKNNFETRVADGAAILQAVDFKGGLAGTTGSERPALTYLRLGKAEEKLVDGSGKALSRESDQLMDQKYKSGIGMFTDGEMDVWTKDDITLRSNKKLHLLSAARKEETYGETTKITYEFPPDAIEKLNAGLVEEDEVERKIVSVELERNTDLGWYKQEYKINRSLSFGASNKGEFSLGASYDLSVGAKFDYSIAAKMEWSFGGKIGLSTGYSIDIDEGGVTFKHPTGSYTQAASAGLSARNKVTIGVSGLPALAVDASVKGYYVALYAAGATQATAFTAYNAIMLRRSQHTLKPGEKEVDPHYDLMAALDHGMKIYEAAISLSSITAAAGFVLAAVHARAQSLSVPDPMVPSITLTPAGGIQMKHGPNSLTIDQTGIKMIGLLGVEVGGMTVKVNAISIDHNPVPPAPPL